MRAAEKMRRRAARRKRVASAAAATAAVTAAALTFDEPSAFAARDDDLAGAGASHFELLAPDLEPQDLTRVGDTLFFVGYDERTKHELWKSDGTTRGTVLVKDIDPVDEYSYYEYPRPIGSVRSTVFFQSDDGTHGIELWSSDGTLDGTAMVADSAPGDVHSAPRDLRLVNGVTFVTARSPDNPSQSSHGLWRRYFEPPGS